MDPSVQHRRIRMVGPLTWGTLLAGVLVVGGIVMYRIWPRIHHWHTAHNAIAALGNPKSQSQASASLIALGAAAVPYLKSALHDPNESVRTGASSVLLRLHPADSANAVIDLIDAVNDPCPEVRINAANALGRIAPYSSESIAKYVPQAVASLSTNLASDDEQVQRAAVASLGRFGPEANVVLPTLEALLEHESPWIRAEAAIAILQVSPTSSDEPVAVLFRLLRDESNNAVRQVAADGLRGMLGPESISPVLKIMHEVRAETGEWAPRPDRPDQSWSLQAMGASVLWRLGERVGPSAGAAVPDLAELCWSEHPEVRKWAKRAMTMIDPTARVSIFHGLHALHDGMIGAAEVFAELSADDQRASIPHLIELMQSEQAAARVGAANALGHVAVHATPAIPVLEKAAADDDSPAVRQSSAEALATIKAASNR
jgi:HEAT repeat protein